MRPWRDSSTSTVLYILPFPGTNDRINTIAGQICLTEPVTIQLPRSSPKYGLGLDRVRCSPESDAQRTNANKQATEQRPSPPTAPPWLGNFPSTLANLFGVFGSRSHHNRNLPLPTSQLQGPFLQPQRELFERVGEPLPSPSCILPPPPQGILRAIAQGERRTRQPPSASPGRFRNTAV